MKPARLETKNQTSEEIAWHAFPLGDVFKHLDSKRDGLTNFEAEERLRRFGSNQLEPEKKRPTAKILLYQFLNPLILILIAAGVLTLIVRSYLNAAVIFAVVALNGFIGFFQEYQAEKSLRSLAKLEVKNAVVRREGAYAVVPADTVVPGDVIAVRAGDRIPADARLIYFLDLKTDESILTGESKEVLKRVVNLNVSSPVFERTNVIFGGTLVTDGGGEAVVFGTGGNSEIGRVACLLKGVPPKRTPLEKKISKLGRFIGFTVVVLSALILVGGMLLNRDPKEMFLVAVAVAVAAVPEGLPVAVTVILATGMRRILKKGSLVRSLAAAEGLGATSVILTDKTGTLTQGEMRVAKILTPERRSGILEMDSTAERSSNHMLVLSYGLLISELFIENPDDEIHEWVIRGSPVDKALFWAATEAGLDFKKLNQKFRKLGQIFFNSRRKYSVSFREDENKDVWALVAGAPDILLNHVKKIQVLNRYENAIPSELAAVKESVDVLAKSGLRVIAVLSKKIDPVRSCARDFVASPKDRGAATSNGVENRDLIQKHVSPGGFGEVLGGLNLVGLVGLKDPVRPDAKDFLALSRRAGIRTVMVTGDHSFTARAVASEVGLTSSNKILPALVEGKDIGSADTKELSHRVRSVDIFSRVTPEQKLRIAEAWQMAGESVAVIGDGVNDAPALKQADTGVSLSMGVDLAKEASDMILLENNFAALVEAIKEGRVILDNIKKVAVYLLSTSFTEIALVGLSLVFGLPLPLSAVQILWINLVQEGFPGLALALDPAEKRVMEDPPPDIRRPILDDMARSLIGVVGGVSAVVLFLMFLFFRSGAEELAFTHSAMFAALGVSTLFFAFSVRNLKRPIWEIPFLENKYLLGSLALGLALTAVALYLPPFSFFLGLKPIGFLEWVIILGAGFMNLILVEAVKWIFIRKRALAR